MCEFCGPTAICCCVCGRGQAEAVPSPLAAFVVTAADLVALAEPVAEAA